MGPVCRTGFTLLVSEGGRWDFLSVETREPPECESGQTEAQGRRPDDTDDEKPDFDEDVVDPRTRRGGGLPPG